MAAPWGKQGHGCKKIFENSSSDLSGSEDERLKEAAIDIKPVLKEPSASSSSVGKTFLPRFSKTRLPIDKPSLRPSVKEKDENDLDTTPEFRAHIAKKLSQIMDGSIENVEVPLENSDAHDNSSSVDIKLFSTSLPEDKIQPVVRKRKVSSSSESDEESKLASVAVTGEYILTQGEQLRREADAAFIETPLSNGQSQCAPELGKVSKKNKKKKKHKEETENKEERVDKCTKDNSKENNTNCNRKKKKHKKEKCDAQEES